MEKINEFNELLYDWIIPRLFNELYELESFEKTDEVEVELVKEPKDKDFYYINAKVNLIASLDDPKFSSFKDKSFHLDNYCFDSNPENHLFWTLLNDDKIKKVWFTGMLTHGQSDFVINYIDPVSNTVRSYYPDFLVQLEDGSYTIIEVKGDNMIDDVVVKAKADYAHQLAVASNMSYLMLKGSDVINGAGLN
ncbi:Tn7 transposase TnsA N-terminal domain-containing protein [Cloacibacterium sp.]|uniref:Tn7 transposase TnsA N-terminal domain-containing protein n=1 Tax=Cloacibacterium sp. TaxID=1913682 RepID=UPI0039E23384